MAVHGSNHYAGTSLATQTHGIKKRARNLSDINPDLFSNAGFPFALADTHCGLRHISFDVCGLRP
jgi:hypothetical protein